MPNNEAEVGANAAESMILGSEIIDRGSRNGWQLHGRAEQLYGAESLRASE